MEQELKETGIYFSRNKINPNLIERLLEPLAQSFKKHQSIQQLQNNEIDLYGVALNILPDHEVFIELLNELINVGVIESLRNHFFHSNFILNSFSGLNNQPGKTNFSAMVHRDSKCYSNESPIMLNALVMLDDFTEENGATLLLPGSHKTPSKPSDEYFMKNCIKAIGNRGDVLVFNSDVWHSSALNVSLKGRRAIPITFSKSFVKQLMDYPRCLGYANMNMYSKGLQQLLGYHSRVPANLEEWYMPLEDRFYKKDQD